MQITTQISSGLETRTKTRRVAGRDDSLLLRATWPEGSEFFSGAAEVTLTDDDSGEHLDFLQCEYDAEMMTDVAALLKARTLVRNQIKEARLPLSSAAYAALCRANYHGNRLIVVFKGMEQISLGEAVKRGYGHWTTRWRNVEPLTKVEYYERMLALYRSASSGTRASLQEALRQARIEEKIALRYDIPIGRDYLWRTEPYKVFVPGRPLWAVKGSWWHTDSALYKAVYEKKSVPSYDWPAIKREWQRRVDDINAKLEPLSSRLAEVNVALRERHPALTHKFQQCVQVRRTAHLAKDVFGQPEWTNGISGCCDRLVLTTGQADIPSLGVNFLGFHAPGGITGHSGDHYWRISEAVEGFDDLSPAAFEGRSMHDIINYVSGSIGHWVGHGTVIDVPFTSGHTLVFPTWSTDEHGVWIATSVRYETTHSRPMPATTEMFVRGRDPSYATSHVLTSFCRDKDASPVTVDNRIASCHAQLLNADLRGRDAIEFNYARSVGELKDLPKTSAQAVSFVRWLHALRKGERTPLYQIRYKGWSKPTLSADPKWERWTAASRKLKARSGKASTGPRNNGPVIRSIRKVEVSPTTPMRHLAEAYLAMKFAVIPTASDIQTLIRETSSWLTTARRELARVYRQWSQTPSARVLRRYFRVADFGKSGRRQPVIENMNEWDPAQLREWHDSVVLTRQQAIGFYLNVPDYLESFHWVSETGQQLSAPCVKTTRGLVAGVPYWYTMNLSGSDVLRLVQAISQHNMQYLPLHFHVMGLIHRLEDRGCVFARYAWNALKVLTDDSSMRNRIAALRLPKTLWELAPLSFVLEWFSNMAEIISAADNLFNASVTGVTPTGGAWLSLSERVWAGYAPPRSGSRLAVVRRVTSCYDMLEHSSGSASVPDTLTRVPRVIEWDIARVDSEGSKLTVGETFPDGIRLRPTGLVNYNRVPLGEDFASLPELQLRLNLDVSKLISLLAIWKVLGKAGRVAVRRH